MFDPEHPQLIKQFERISGLQKEKLEILVADLERNQPLSPEEQSLCKVITVARIQSLLDSACQMIGRKRTVLLLDDAALTLTPNYLVELLDVVRALKTSTIAPKASVYPGTTEY
ncbi:hypothetical protein, partial [Streptomyces cyaneofuscatus]|uniref:hypothetical protein n=1 Tax=Streptomyces cyaneofuscatus TaxID=66883 RepID=UPI002FF10B61